MTNTEKALCLYCTDDTDHSNGCPSFKADLEKQKQYQRAQGNNCTLCYNNNWMNQCSSCGWWGYVKPELKEVLS